MNIAESVIFEKLYTRLYELLFNLNRYVPNPGCEAILKIYEKLDITIMMIRYLKVCGKYNDLLKTQAKVNIEVEKIFLEDLVILPDINLSLLWPKLSQGQKDKVWTWLRLVYMTGFQAIEQSHVNSCKKDIIETNNIKNDKSASDKSISDKSISDKSISDKSISDKSISDKSVGDKSNKNVKEKEKIHIDPFVGVGNNNQEYCVNDIYQNMETLEDIKYKDPCLGSLVSFLSIDKLIDIDKITDQLNNMTQEDIEKATDNIQSLLSTHDPNTQSFLKNMLDKIRDELKNVDLSQGTSAEKIEKLTGIVGNVTSGMKNHVTNGNVDVKSMLNNAHGLFKEIATSDNVKPEEREQINNLSSFFNGLKNDPSKIGNKKYMNDMFKQVGVDPKQFKKMTKSFKK